MRNHLKDKLQLQSFICYFSKKEGHVYWVCIVSSSVAVWLSDLCCDRGYSITPLFAHYFVQSRTVPQIEAKHTCGNVCSGNTPDSIFFKKGHVLKLRIWYQFCLRKMSLFTVVLNLPQTLRTVLLLSNWALQVLLKEPEQNRINRHDYLPEMYGTRLYLLMNKKVLPKYVPRLRSNFALYLDTITFIFSFFT